MWYNHYMARRRPRRRSAQQKEKRVTAHLVREIATWVILGLGAVLLAVLLVMGFGLRMEMTGDSMEPTITSGQHVLVNRLSYQMSTPARGDIIAFHAAGNRERTYIKRVVAVGGDTVRIADGMLYVNGQAQDDSRFDRMRDGGIASEEITLATGEYFVLGDNRNNSEDSRSANIGIVRRDTIAGKVWYTY